MLLLHLQLRCVQAWTSQASVTPTPRLSFNCGSFMTASCVYAMLQPYGQCQCTGWGLAASGSQMQLFGCSCQCVHTHNHHIPRVAAKRYAHEQLPHRLVSSPSCTTLMNATQTNICKQPCIAYANAACILRISVHTAMQFAASRRRTAAMS